MPIKQNYIITEEILSNMEDVFQSQFKKVGEDGWRFPANAMSCFEAYCRIIRSNKAIEWSSKPYVCEEHTEKVMCSYKNEYIQEKHDAVVIAEYTKKMQSLIDAAQEFVDRCERGEVRSKYTYAKFKKILESLKEK